MLLVQVESFNSPLIAAIIFLAISMRCFGEGENTRDASFVEVFTASPFSVDEQYLKQLNEKGGAKYKLYTIDRIDQLQQVLSRGLPGDPVEAKQEALKRFQSMDAALSRQLENAAKGLAKALQYGIDRYPAIVFEGKAVIYGVTDLDVATNHYRRWQAQASEWCAAQYFNVY